MRLMVITCGDQRGIKHAYHEMIAGARRRVLITNAYFYPDNEMLEALKAAAQRGVKVQVIVPGKSDIDIMITAARSIYSDLLAAGVEVYEYQPSVLHAKTVIVDGCWAMVGSCNLDARSLDFNHEANVGSIGHEVAAQLEERFTADLRSCVRIKSEQWRRRPLSQKMSELAVGMLGSQL